MVGKINNPKFCYLGDTYSAMYGLTSNPWDHNRTPGGSAVAIATGMAEIAIDTDGGRLNPHPRCLLRDRRTQTNLWPGSCLARFSWLVDDCGRREFCFRRITS
jgi:hypothetical protein